MVTPWGQTTLPVMNDHLSWETTQVNGRSIRVLLYRQAYDIRRIKSQNLNIVCLVLQLSFPSPLKPGVKSRMEM